MPVKKRACPDTGQALLSPDSDAVAPGRGKDFLDWETINKLCEKNGAVAKFVDDVKIDFVSKRIHKAEYDEIPKDPETSERSWESNN